MVVAIAVLAGVFLVALRLPPMPRAGLLSGVLVGYLIHRLQGERGPARARAIALVVGAAAAVAVAAAIGRTALLAGLAGQFVLYMLAGYLVWRLVWPSRAA